MDFEDDIAADFFGEDELFGGEDDEPIGDDEAIEDNRYDGKGKKGESSFFTKKFDQVFRS